MDCLTMIKSPIENELTNFNKLFAESMISTNLLLNSALEHIMKSNGKMMRPILLFLTTKLLGDINNEAMHAAASLEFLHNASLVHDDIVDVSNERRNQPSVNAIFNNKVAVLVGDYLLATSLKHAGLTHNYNIIDVVATLGQELSDGEILQLVNISNTDFSEVIYFDVIRKKTAVLFAACTKAAALAVHADDEMVEKMRQFGENIGICFQIKDDIFDYYDSKTIGKPTGNDMKEGKLTLPVLYVLNEFKDSWAIELAQRIKSAEATDEEISTMLDYTKKKGGIEYAETIMYQYKQKAIEQLMTFPETEVRDSLFNYLNYVIDRSK